jgi:hypothetical protein
VPHERLTREFDKWWQELKDKLDEVWKSSEVENIAGFKWLFLREDIVAIQNRHDCKAVRVIASQPYLDSDVKEVMRKLMKAEGVYTYIVPDSLENKASVKEFEREFVQLYPGRAILRRIPLDDFNSIAAVDYVIVNPDDSPGYPRQMFLELPIGSDGKYWTKVEGRAAENFHTRFLPYAVPKKEDFRPKRSIRGSRSKGSTP